MSETTNKQDEQIKQLGILVAAKKEEISKAERPNWITNGSFKYGKNSTESFNLQTISDSIILVNALAMLMDRESSFEKAATELGVTAKFDWFGYSVSDWKDDFKTRIAKIEIKNLKQELAEIETVLNDLTSDEVKKQNKLDAIAAKLGVK